MHTSTRMILAGLLGAFTLGLTATPSAAAPTLGERVMEATANPYTKEIIERLIEFKVSDKCRAKMGDANYRAGHAGTFVVRDLAAYAKHVTGDDWDAIEYADKQANAPKVAAMIEAFAQRFKIVVDIEGDDCGTLWISYWGTIATAINTHRFDVPSLHVTLKVTKAARAVTTTVNADGSKIEFVAPRDVEPRDWSTLLAKPFHQRQTGFVDDFAYAMMRSSDPVAARVAEKLFKFKVGKTCRAKLPTTDGRAVHAMSFAARDVIAFAAAQTGDDWNTIYAQNGDRAANQPIVFEMIDTFAKRFQFVITVDGDDCGNDMSALWAKYLTTVSRALAETKAVKAPVTIELAAKAKAKTVSVKVTKASKGKPAKISLTAPLAVEAKDWSSKLEAPFKK